MRSFASLLVAWVQRQNLLSDDEFDGIDSLLLSNHKNIESTVVAQPHIV